MATLLESNGPREILGDSNRQRLHMTQEETDIKGAFESIYSGIEEWVDKLSSPYDGELEGSSEASFRHHAPGLFEAQFKRRLEEGKESLSTSFAALGLYPTCCSDVQWLEHLGASQHCMKIVLSLVISKYLTDEIFRCQQTEHWGNLYPHGVSQKDIAFMVAMHCKMRQSGQNDSQISQWHGQTISTFLAFDVAQDLDKAACMEHHSTLQHTLESWLGQQLDMHFSAMLMMNIILPAHKALETVCCSTRTYLTVPPTQLDEASENLQIKDLMSWQLAPVPKPVDVLQCLYPGVLRMADSEVDALLLVKPTWVGYTMARD